MTIPRRHHYITQKYLLNFCDTDKKKKKFYVYDQKKTWRVTQPINECIEKDFQKIDHFIGLNPHIFEIEFGKIESLGITVIDEILSNKKIPAKIVNYHPLINLIGMFAGRNPYQKNIIKKQMINEALVQVKFLLKSPSNFYQNLKNAHKEGLIPENIHNYTEALIFFQRGLYKIIPDDSLAVENMMKKTVIITQALLSMNWMLLESKSTQFITSNAPVGIALASGNFRIPEFGITNSFVTFPISPTLALVGSYSPLPSFKIVDTMVVNGINWLTAFCGAKYIYSTNPVELPHLYSVIQLQLYHQTISSRLISNLIN